MKRAIYLMLCILPLLAGCSKTRPLSDYPFTSIDISKICMDVAYIDIVPENNDFYFYFEVLEKSHYDKFGTEKELISTLDEKIKTEYDEFWYQYMSFETLYLHKGAYDENYYTLDPGTDYVLVAYGYNDDLTPMEHVSTAAFRTLDKKDCDLTFSVSLSGSVVTVTPSNDNDTYFWEYESVETVEEEYLGSAAFYYYDIVMLYWEYDFLPGFESQGVEDSDLTWFYDIEPGDQFYLIASGYDQGFTTDFYIYKLTYNGEGEEGTVETSVYPIYSEDAAESAIKPHTPSFTGTFPTKKIRRP